MVEVVFVAALQELHDVVDHAARGDAHRLHNVSILQVEGKMGDGGWGEKK